MSVKDPTTWEELLEELDEMIKHFGTISKRVARLYIVAQTLSDTATEKQMQRVEHLCNVDSKELWKSLKFHLIGILFYIQQSFKNN
jgi:hypothetical protein